MELEIRDTQSSASMTIPAAGLTFGREGSSSADLTVPDRTVSSKHAKIFARDSKWYIEDLRSSNGTFVNGERVTTPIQLTVGDRFSLCRYGFEVVRVVGDAQNSATAVLGDAALTDDGSGDAATPVSRAHAEDRQPVASVARTAEGVPEPSPRQPSSSPQTLPAPAPKVGGGFVALVFKAVAYYLAAVPLLLTNPIGFVRKGVANQRFAAFGPTELIAYAVPAFVVGAGLGIISSTIYQLIWGQIGLSLFITPVIMLGAYAVAAIVTGFIWHPLLGWFVRLLRGESTPESRSNYFVMVYTGVILTFIPTAVATFMGLIPEPLLGALPMVLALAANLILAFISYTWFRFFNVVKWFPILLIVLGGLSCAMTVKGLVDLVRLRIAGGGVATAGAVPDVDVPATGGGGDAAAMQARVAELQKELHAAAASGANAEELAARAAELQELQLAATKAAGTPTSTGPAVARVGTAEASEGVADGETKAGGETKPEPAPSSVATPTEARATEARAPEARPPATPRPAKATTDYEEFLRKRQAVEGALERDPTLLKRKGVEALYKELHKIAYKVKQKHKVKMGKRVTAEKVAQQKVAEKLRDAEIYELSSGLVDKLYKKVVDTP